MLVTNDCMRETFTLFKIIFMQAIQIKQDQTQVTKTVREEKVITDN